VGGYVIPSHHNLFSINLAKVLDNLLTVWYIGYAGFDKRLTKERIHYGYDLV
jgi:hypothetical protein